jgi:uncharacterized protein
MPVATPTRPLDAHFEIAIAGSPLSVEAEVHVTGITVDDDVMLPGMFAIEMTGSASRGSELDWLDDRRFGIGTPVEVRLGYARDVAPVIVGEITSLEPDFSSDRPPSLTVRGYDRSHRLMRGKHTRTFVQQSDSDIAAQIAREAGLRHEVTESRVIHAYVLQANQTDLAFLQARAQAIGYEVMVRDKTLLFRPIGNEASEGVTLTLGEDLSEFYPRLASMQQVSEVIVQGWDAKEKEAVVARYGLGSEGSQMGGRTSGAALVDQRFGSASEVVCDRQAMNQAEADLRAKAAFRQANLGLIVGEGVCLGRTDLQAGKVIAITGLGQRFSGRYYLTAVSHRYRADVGYSTHFQVRRNATSGGLGRKSHDQFIRCVTGF